MLSEYWATVAEELQAMMNSSGSRVLYDGNADGEAARARWIGRASALIEEVQRLDAEAKSA